MTEHSDVASASCAFNHVDARAIALRHMHADDDASAPDAMQQLRA